MTAAVLPRFVAYYRVSTDRQRRSGLGLHAQREAVPSTWPGPAAWSRPSSRRWRAAGATTGRSSQVGKFLLTQMATVAELEAGLISQRTRAALAGAKARGTRLGNPQLRSGTPEHARAAAAAKSTQARARAADVVPYIEAACRAGARTLHELAEALTNCDVPTPAGKGPWRPEQKRRMLARAASSFHD
jgi:hypothetical protein